MFKHTPNVAVIAFSLSGFSAQSFHFLENPGHGISLIDGSSAVETLNDVLKTLNTERDTLMTRIGMIDTLGVKAKTILNSWNENQAIVKEVKSKMDSARSIQEVFRSKCETISTLIDEANQLKTFALKHDKEVSGEEDQNDPQGGTPEPIQEILRNLFKSFEDPLNAGQIDGNQVCCGMCGGDHETPSGESLGELLAEALSNRQASASKPFNPQVIEDFMNGMTESGEKEVRGIKINLNDPKLKDLISKSKKVPGANGMSYIDITAEELSKALGISVEELARRSVIVR